jgi:hypothetical protein
LIHPNAKTAYYEDMNDLDTSDPLEFDLYYTPNHEAALLPGVVKSYGVKEGGSTIYDKRTKKYDVKVERLLWVDGWKKTTVEGSKKVQD